VKNWLHRNDLVFMDLQIRSLVQPEKWAHQAGPTGLTKIGMSIYVNCRHLFTDNIVVNLKLIEGQNRTSLPSEVLTFAKLSHFILIISFTIQDIETPRESAL